MKRKADPPVKKIYTFETPSGNVTACDEHSIDIMRMYPGAPGHQAGGRCEYCRDPRLGW